jgi:hypothetical protein
MAQELDSNWERPEKRKMMRAGNQATESSLAIPQ